jgi:hypothetical protein
MRYRIDTWSIRKIKLHLAALAGEIHYGRCAPLRRKGTGK